MQPYAMKKFWAFENISIPLAVAVVICGAFLVYRNAADMRASAEESRHAELIINEVSGLLSALKDAETGQRGYLLTGRESYLEPYRSSLALVQEKVSALGHDVRLQANVGRLPRLEQLVSEKMAELEATIETRRARGFEAALLRVDTDEGKRLMDEIRTVCASIDKTVREPMAEARRRADSSAERLGREEC